MANDNDPIEEDYLWTDEVERYRKVNHHTVEDLTVRDPDRFLWIKCAWRATWFAIATVFWWAFALGSVLFAVRSCASLFGLGW
jgi:hypothetical protein